MFMYLPFQNVHSPQEAPDYYINQYPSINNLQRRTLAGMLSFLMFGAINLKVLQLARIIWKQF